MGWSLYLLAFFVVGAGSMGGQAIQHSIGEQYPAHVICCGVSGESKRSPVDGGCRRASPPILGASKSGFGWPWEAVG